MAKTSPEKQSFSTTLVQKTKEAQVWAPPVGAIRSNFLFDSKLVNVLFAHQLNHNALFWQTLDKKTIELN